MSNQKTTKMNDTMQLSFFFQKYMIKNLQNNKETLLLHLKNTTISKLSLFMILRYSHTDIKSNDALHIHSS